jgi:hypothetical protein
MPTPGVPDWACVGAVIRPNRNNVYVPGLRFVITRIEFQPSVRPEVEAGAYAFALNPLVPDVYQRVLDRAVGGMTVNLASLIDHYAATGEYMDENEHLVGYGTTAPVSMFAQGLDAGDEVVITGSADHDGVYRVGYAHYQHIMLNRDHDPVTPEIEDQMARDLARSRHDEASLHDLAGVPDSGSEVFPDDTDGYDPFYEGLPEMGQDLVDPPYAERVVDNHGFGLPSPDMVVPGYGPSGAMLDWEDTIFETPEPDPAAEGVLPDVVIGHTWVLPAPNTGVWRVAAARSEDARRNTLSFRMEHTTERDRSMTCTRTWLVNNGSRRDPPDPRAQPTSASPVALGQVWDIAPSNTRYHSSPNRLWRVLALTTAGQVMLVSEDGLGKRLYWAPTRLQQHGTFLGDGVPRRTAYEHVLADALDDDS